MNRKHIFVFTFVYLFLALGGVALAASGGEHHDAGVPTRTVIFQLINLSLFVGVLVFFIRKPIRDYFSTRSLTYRDAAEKAERAIKQAELQKVEMAEQLSQLSSSADASLGKAKEEAEELKRQIIQEAENLTLTLRQEAERTVKYEIERAKAALRDEMLEQAIHVAQTRLDGKMAEPDQRRLQTEFVEKIQVVNR